jgi:hypothetical protein
MRRFSLLLALTAPLSFAACSGDSTSSAGQMITCSTDPGTGVILSCTGGDDGSGSNSCHDIDEDGDGEPHDQNDDSSIARLAPRDGADDGSNHDADDDHDGIPNDDDCDTHDGEDDGSGSTGAQLPYDVKPQLGATVTPIADAFAEEGQQPAAIVSVTGATWRAAELGAGTPFVVTQDDCNHAGNRATGRDRVVVTWTNADGSTASDHLDIRYCNAN